MIQMIPTLYSLRGTVEAPGDKSLAHRALLCAALADGVSVIDNLPRSRDVSATLQALEALGVGIQKLHPACVRIRSDGRLRQPDGPIDCRNSGTTMRLLAGVLAGAGIPAELFGDESLSRRPMERVAEPLRLMGAVVRTADGFPPLRIESGVVRPVRHAAGIASAQVKSAVLFAGLFASGTTEVTEPLPSRDHTERLLEFLGVPVFRDRCVAAVYGRARPRPFTFTLPADPSSAAFVAAAAMLLKDSELKITNVLYNPTRLGFFRAAIEMGADVNFTDIGPAGPEDCACLTVKSSRLRGIVIDGELALHAIDELPLLALLGAFAEGETVIRDAAELRKKESDRILATIEMVRALGGRAEEFEDGIRVFGGMDLHGGVILSRGDHRIALCGAVAGAVVPHVEVEGFECSETSFPGILDLLDRGRTKR